MTKRLHARIPDELYKSLEELAEEEEESVTEIIKRTIRLAIFLRETVKSDRIAFEDPEGNKTVFIW